jgi:hypothetical protein
VAGDGNDYLSNGEVHKNNLSAGVGNDVLDVIDKPVVKDVVACGSGFDRVLANRKDVVAPDCERVTVGLRNVDAFYDSIPQSFWEGLPEY